MTEETHVQDDDGLMDREEWLVAMLEAIKDSSPTVADFVQRLCAAPFTKAECRQIRDMLRQGLREEDGVSAEDLARFEADAAGVAWEDLVSLTERHVAKWEEKEPSA